ncbi:MAG: hypothetical protein HBSAPP03_11950 [Phycisphaerae bacterium]|nr:MAG: hypothetical protein HBSAPP03_11950 [Phycisphaerae bacterium]
MGVAVGKAAFDDGAGAGHGHAGGVAERHNTIAACDREDLVEGERQARERERGGGVVGHRMLRVV